MWPHVILFINQNGPLWSFLVTIATIVYVILTNRMLRESEKVRKLQTRPYIIADIIIDGFWIKMTIKNVGNGPALHVKAVSPQITSNPLENIDFLAPGKELGNVIGDLSGHEKESKIFNFDVRYKDSSDEDYHEKYTVDITPLLSSRNWGESENKDLIKELHGLVEKNEKILDALKGIEGSMSKQADAARNIERKLK